MHIESNQVLWLSNRETRDIEKPESEEYRNRKHKDSDRRIIRAMRNIVGIRNRNRKTDNK